MCRRLRSALLWMCIVVGVIAALLATIVLLSEREVFCACPDDSRRTTWAGSVESHAEVCRRACAAPAAE